MGLDVIRHNWISNCSSLLFYNIIKIIFSQPNELSILVSDVAETSLGISLSDSTLINQILLDNNLSIIASVLSLHFLFNQVESGRPGQGYHNDDILSLKPPYF